MHNDDPKNWGAQFWFPMRKIAEQYPVSNPAKEVSDAARDYYMSFRHLLPCEKCRIHYAEILESAPPVVTDRAALMNWVEYVAAEVERTIPKPPPAVPKAPFVKILPTRRIGPPGRATAAASRVVAPHPRVVPPARQSRLTAVKAQPTKPAPTAAKAKAVGMTQPQKVAVKAIPAAAKKQHAIHRPVQKHGCSSCAAARKK